MARVRSLQRIGIGVGAAIAVGIPVSLLMSTVRWIGLVMEPYLHFLRSLPPLGYIGLLIVWFGMGDTSKILREPRRAAGYLRPARTGHHRGLLRTLVPGRESADQP